VLTLAAVAETAAAAVGAAVGHLDGLALALLAVFVAEGLVTAPPVIRAALGHGGHRRPAAAPERNTGNSGKPVKHPA
jgi:hypothetical protein